MIQLNNDTPPPEETLHIQNFAGITDATITLSRMNVFIGPQASGKSVCAKLIFYFRQIVTRLTTHVFFGEDTYKIYEKNIDLFSLYFPNDNWGTEGFSVRYEFGKVWFEVNQDDVDLSFVNLTSSDYWEELELTDQKDITFKLMPENLNASEYPNTTFSHKKSINDTLNDQLGRTLTNSAEFIAAGRSFFATFANINYILQSQGVEIDPFLVEFGRLYQRAENQYRETTIIPNVQKLLPAIERILYGRYVTEPGRRYILSQDKRQVLLANCSSGQQEAAPLTFILKHIASHKFGSQSTTLFVEEPEAHLYPDAQREMVHLLCTALDLTSPESSSQCVITTHSPYILTALNNLMYGAKIANEFPTRLSEVRSILGETDLIPPEHVRAYVFKDGTVKSIISEKTGLVVARELDGVSDKLAQEFEALVEIAFKETEDE